MRIQLYDDAGNLLDDYTEHFLRSTVEGKYLLLNDKPIGLQGLVVMKILQYWVVRLIIM